MDRCKFNFGGCELNLIKNGAGCESKYLLPGKEFWTGSNDCGKVNFQLYRGRGYQLWYNTCEVKKSATLFVNVNRPVLMFSALLDGDFEYWCNGLGLAGKQGQYQILGTRYLDAHVCFGQCRTHETFSIHFEPAFLNYYARYSPQLSVFLETMEKEKSARLFDHSSVLPLAMEADVRAMLTYRYHGELADRFIDGKIHELLTHLVHHLNLLDKLPEPGPLEAGKAEAAKNIISADLSRYDSVEVLARKVHTTEAKLQAAFRLLYGTTVGKFSRELRLRKAHELLSSDTGCRETLLGVALSVGYNDVANFSNAFKQFFGYPPGQIYKRSKSK